MTYLPSSGRVLGRAIDANVATSSTDVTIPISASNYLITNVFVVFGTGSSSLATLVSELRTAAAGAGTKLSDFALNVSLTGTSGITMGTNLLTSSLRTETTLYWRITTGVTSGVASIYIIGVPI